MNHQAWTIDVTNLANELGHSNGDYNPTLTLDKYYLTIDVPSWNPNVIVLINQLNANELGHHLVGVPQ